MKNVLGFGACMIAGSPFEHGFLQMAMPDDCNLTIKSFGGFPIHRAAKHFKKALNLRSFDLVVVQFGAIDCNVDLSLLAYLRSGSAQMNSLSTSPSTPYRSASALRWQALNLLAMLSKHRVSDITVFISAMEGIVTEATDRGAKVIIVSPFVSGPNFKHKRAALYRDRLSHLASKYQNVSFLDALSYLESFPKKTTLMHNGFHLSATGHRLLAKIVRSKIEDCLYSISDRSELH